MQPSLHQSPQRTQYLGPPLLGNLPLVCLTALSEPQHCLLVESIERQILSEELELVRATKEWVLEYREVQGEIWNRWSSFVERSDRHSLRACPQLIWAAPTQREQALGLALQLAALSSCILGVLLCPAS